MSTLDEGEVLVGINTDDPQGTLDVNGRVYVSETTAPDTPASGKGAVYEKTDGKLYFKNDGGTEYDLTDTGGGGGGGWTDDGSAVRLTTITDTVGIGVAVPDTKLHVSSGAGANGDCILTIESDTDNAVEGANPQINFTQDGGNIWSAVISDDNELTFLNSVSTRGGIVFATNNDNAGYTAATERMRITGADGFVGIGVVAPQGILDISGAFYVAEISAPGTPSSGTGVVYVNSADSKIYFKDDSGTAYDLTNAGTVTATFKTFAVSGQSDIVADSATDTFTVAAGSNITLTTNAGTDTLTIAATDTTGGWTDDGGTVRLTTASDDVAVGTATATAKLTVDGDVHVEAGHKISIGETSPTAMVQVRNSGTAPNFLSCDAGATDLDYAVEATEHMQFGTWNGSAATLLATLEYGGDFILEDGDLLIDGGSTEVRRIKLGDGRSGDGYSEIDLIGDATYTAYGTRISRASGQNGATYMNHRGTGGLYLWGLDASYVAFGTTNTERMRIESGGDVGIGTTNPTEKLEVVGNVLLDANDATLQIKGGGAGTNGRILWTFNSDATVYGSIDLDYNARNTSGLKIDSNYVLTLQGNALYFQTSDTTRMTVVAGGDVGIGTTAPAVKTHIRQDTAAAGAIDEVLRLESYDATGHNLTDANGVSMTFYVPEDTGSDLGAKIEARRSSNTDTNTQTDLRFYTYADNGVATTYAMLLQHDGDMFVPRVYSNTTGTAANINVNSSGHFQRYSSASKYKTDVEDVDYEWSEKIIAETRPVWYRSLCTGDNPDWSHWGFIAEEVGEVDPRLAEWNEKEDGSLEAEGVQYTKFIPHLLAVVQKQQKLIELLELRLAALEGT